MYNEILDAVANWFLNYADANMQSVVIDSDGIARISGEFDLGDLVDALIEEAL